MFEEPSVATRVTRCCCRGGVGLVVVVVDVVVVVIVVVVIVAVVVGVKTVAARPLFFFRQIHTSTKAMPPRPSLYLALHSQSSIVVCIYGNPPVSLRETRR